jgi:hypothetical protein
MKLSTTIARAAFYCLLPFSVFAHGLGAERIEGGTGIAATYSDGSPMAFVDVTVYAPDAEEEIFQEGTTDRDGRFVFFPAMTGKWMIEVDDGMGHALRKEVEVLNEPAALPSPSAKTNPLTGVITGLSIIFGLFGCWALWRSRRGAKG